MPQMLPIRQATMAH